MESLKRKIEELGWTVSDCEFGPGTPGWEIQQHSPAGEDFIFGIEHGDDPERAVKEIGEYAGSFDIDEHVTMWLDAKGRVSGVPDAVTLVDDARDIKKMLDDLYSHIHGNFQEAEEEPDVESLKRFKEYFDKLYGTGLEVAGWHQNGALEPFDEFYEEAVRFMEK